MSIRRCLLLAVLLPGLRLLAQEAVVIPRDELSHAPTPARVASLVDRAALKGWGSAVPALRSAALQAYETNTGYPTAWYYLYRWADLLATPHDRALEQWIQAVEKAGVAHSNMASTYAHHPGSLAARMSRELQLAALGNAALSEEFFLLLSPVDNPIEVLAILQKIFAQDPALFGDYGNLALAIAVVYDVPPPPMWPHGQVSREALPRRLPAPEQAFSYWVRLDRTNVTLHRLRRLPASELKFMVDLAAPFAELDWARQNVAPGLADFAHTYDLIKYRKDRLAQGKFQWSRPDYRLPTILAEGGICVDQAYFASTVGKAKGIPTLMFRGAGLDGRHAWFGYLDGNQIWQLDCGRYAEQKFVVGQAFDPQTWGDINDHELLFITERFRALPTYRLSVMHTAFATEYLREHQAAAALKAAHEAVNRDRRNLEAWNVLLEAEAAAGEDSRVREGTLREAKLAFQRYPDLEVAFSRRLTELLRARGEGSVANVEEQRLTQKYQASREDLSIQQAAERLERSAKEFDLPAQIRVYNQVLDSSGRGAGIDFFDKVVVPFVVHLANQGQIPAALQSLERAHHTLRVEPGSQVEAEISALASRLKAGKITTKSPGG